MVTYRNIAATFALLAGLASPARADPVSIPIAYTFSFESAGLMEEYGSPIIPHPSFTFSFILPDFVRATGLFELPAPVAIGSETITHFGANSSGSWIFGNGLFDTISEEGWGITFDTVAFAFNRANTGFITAPARLTGYSVTGATSYLVEPQLRITGSGTVAVSPVPEPATLLLLGTGTLVLARRFRHKR